MNKQVGILLGLIGLLFAWKVFEDASPPNIEPPTDGWFQQEVANEGLPVLVKFGANWCPPCRAMEPTLKSLASKMQGELKVVEIDVDKHPELARHYRVSGIPYLILLDHGKPLADSVGADSLEGLERWVHQHIDKIR